MLEKIKDPGSAITHFIGMLMAMFAATPLIIKSLHEPDYIHVISLTVFIVSMILLYAASTIYHTLNLSERTNRILRKLDHSMIFVLIAGSYTPICLIVLKGPVGYFLFALVWAIALIGIIVKICWITCPKWFSSVLYISMGWVCVLAFTQIVNSLSPAAFGCRTVPLSLRGTSQIGCRGTGYKGSCNETVRCMVWFAGSGIHYSFRYCCSVLLAISFR